MISLLARDDGHAISQRFAAADGLLHMSTSGETSWMGSHVRLSMDFEAVAFNLPPTALQRSRPGSFLQKRLGHTTLGWRWPPGKGLAINIRHLARRARPGTGRLGPLAGWWRLIAIQTTDNFQAEPVIQAGTIHRHTPNASMGSSPFFGRAFEAENVSPICGGA
jgi:hypothetical protein